MRSAYLGSQARAEATLSGQGKIALRGSGSGEIANPRPLFVATLALSASNPKVAGGFGRGTSHHISQKTMAKLVSLDRQYSLENRIGAVRAES